MLLGCCWDRMFLTTTITFWGSVVSSRLGVGALMLPTSLLKNQRTNNMSSSSSSSYSSLLDGDLSIYHLDSVASTQDEARRFLQESKCTSTPPTPHTTTTAARKTPFLAVTAREQHQGRGTSGRAWMGQPGNLFLTVCLPRSHLHPDFPLTLLPLQIGNVLATRLQAMLDYSCQCQSHTTTPANINASTNTTTPRVSLKWPNDVLVNGDKVAGVLMESELVAETNEHYFLVGVGINLLRAPVVPTEGSNRGRAATALLDHCRRRRIIERRDDDDDDDDDDLSSLSLLLQDESNTPHQINSNNNISKPSLSLSQVLGQDLAVSLVEWWKTANGDSAEQVRETWKSYCDFSLSQTIRETGELVQPLWLGDDGQLRVRGQDGQERLLVADYLF